VDAAAAPGSAPTWAEVLEAAGRHAWRGQPLLGLGEDSRRVGPGWIFVAVPGTHVDGHRFIPAAVAAGARLVVCERPVRCEVPLCTVPDARRALSALAAAWFGHPARGMRNVGLTGTNGKTTTAHLVASVLTAAGFRPCTIGTLGTEFGGRTLDHTPWTTPPPVELHRALAEARRAGADSSVLEVSVQAIGQSRVADCPFEAAAITTLARDHREIYPDHETYARAKAGLFRLLGPGATAVLNRGLAEYPLFREACACRVLDFGPGGDVEAVSVRPRGLRGTDLALRWPGAAAPLRVRLRLPGAHNVGNALCAAAVGAAFGLPAEAVAAGIGALASVPGRMEIAAHRPCRVVVDYAHNPAGLRSLLRLLREATPGRLVLVMGARGERDPGKRPLMGAGAAALADEVIVTSDRPASEDPAGAARPMHEAVRDAGVPVRFLPDRYEALAAALQDRVPGDCVVAVGKGREPWEGDSAVPDMDDVRACRALAAEGAPSVDALP
jgi:UDP-N-acetylmuramoyl-L-alanyl-D-glutamate--2,6-diaminopimelate ligase